MISAAIAADSKEVAAIAVAAALAAEKANDISSKSNRSSSE
jgi:hypothetical protein